MSMKAGEERRKRTGKRGYGEVVKEREGKLERKPKNEWKRSRKKGT